MQGKCWRYQLSSGNQSQEYYLESTPELKSDGECPQGTYCDWGTMYSSLGMSLHALDNDQVLFGAPGTYSWKGTIAAAKYVEIIFLMQLKLYFLGMECFSLEESSSMTPHQSMTTLDTLLDLASSPETPEADITWLEHPELVKQELEKCIW